MEIDAIYRIILEKCEIHKKSTLLVAVSGGPDSICLLDILSGMDFRLSVAHFNHLLRPEAGSDESFVRKIAKDYRIAFYSDQADVGQYSQDNNTGVEESARILRYKFLYKTAKKISAKAVVVAHHADDQIETILLHLIRGSGLRGLTGMDYVAWTGFDRTIPLIRPLLDAPKEEIIKYCKNKHLAYVTDASNLDSTYTRNNLRNVIIPLIEKVNPRFKDRLLTMRNTLSLDYKCIQEEVRNLAEKIVLSVEDKNVSFSISGYRSLKQNERRLIMIHFLEWYFPGFSGLSTSLIDEVNKFIETYQGGSRSCIVAKDINLFIENNIGYVVDDIQKISGKNEPMMKEDCINIDPQGSTEIGEGWVIKADNVDRGDFEIQMKSTIDKNIAFFDRKQITGCMFCRKWKRGDRFSPLGMQNQTLKMSDFWINRKIPQISRKQWPLLCDQKSILWVVGLQRSERAKISDNSIDIVRLMLIHKGG